MSSILQCVRCWSPPNISPPHFCLYGSASVSLCPLPLLEFSLVLTIRNPRHRTEQEKKVKWDPGFSQSRSLNSCFKIFIFYMRDSWFTMLYQFPLYGKVIYITSRQIGGETMETVTDCIFLGSEITADGDCSHEIKSCLLLGKKLWPT